MSLAPLATSVPVIPHADPDVGGLQRRGIVDPVAGHGHDLSALLPGVHDADLVFGRHPRVDRVLVDRLLERGVV
jgi:hypothetical protein